MYIVLINQNVAPNLQFKVTTYMDTCIVDIHVNGMIKTYN